MRPRRLATTETLANGGDAECGDNKENAAMNPNTSVYFSTILENHRQLDRTAAKGWAIDEATAQSSSRPSTIAATFKRVTTATFDRPRQLVREATQITVRRGATTPGIDILR